MRVLELFGGYGSQALALENLGIDFKSDLCEIDKYAIQAYNQLHGETFNYGDICKIDETKLPYYDLITYSSPCQDFSVAGKQAGGDKGSGTRSSLLWECERIIRAVKPQYLLMENVKNLVGETHIHNFIAWLRVLEEIGYRSFWKVLNAKDYGVPQNRERVFVVSILGGGQYQFPEPIKLTKRLKDVLEQNVDEKYYISSEKWLNRIPFQVEHGYSTLDADVIGTQTARQYASLNGAFVSTPLNTDTDGCSRSICSNYYKQTQDNVMGVGFGITGVAEPLCCASRGRNPENPNDRTTGSPTEQRLELNETGCSNTLTSVQKDNYVLEPSVKQVGNICDTNSFGGNPQIGGVYSSEGCSPTLNTCQGGGHEPKIVDDIYHNREPREYSENSPTLRANHSGDLKVNNGYRIRKLTPRECWRLMGVRDEQFDKLHDISNSQLYKMAGNSIVVDVLMGIFRNLFIDKDQKGQLQLL